MVCWSVDHMMGWWNGRVPELANLGGKQHPMDIIFSLFPVNFSIDFPLSPTDK